MCMRRRKLNAFDVLSGVSAERFETGHAIGGSRPSLVSERGFCGEFCRRFFARSFSSVDGLGVVFVSSEISSSWIEHPLRTIIAAVAAIVVTYCLARRAERLARLVPPLGTSKSPRKRGLFLSARRCRFIVLFARLADTKVSYFCTGLSGTVCTIALLVPNCAR